MEKLISLGSTDVCVSPLGLGTWQWGDRLIWGYGATHTDRDLHDALQASLETGVNLLDTAEVYGRGRSERLLGAYLQEWREQSGTAHPVVATKFMPFPYRLRKGALRSALLASLDRLKMDRIDLYQVHWPLPPVPIEVWADALAEVVEGGLARSVGVSNYNVARMSRAHAVLSRRGIPLASNQVEYHLLDRRVERNGVVELCRALRISVIAYCPLAKGLLTGKYGPEAPPPGLRGRLTSRARLGAIQPLVTLMRTIGQDHDGKSPAQVALNWIIAKGAIPIPGAKNGRQARENGSAMGWRLTDSEVAALDLASDGVGPR
jgi:aryl-alcohol dehydrogenase-like predicted oxidoreductase